MINHEPTRKRHQLILRRLRLLSEIVSFHLRRLKMGQLPTPKLVLSQAWSSSSDYQWCLAHQWLYNAEVIKYWLNSSRVFTIPMILAAINCMAVEHGFGSKAFPTVLRFGGSHICCISMRVDFLCSPIRSTLSKRIPSCDSQMSSFPNFQARGGFGRPPLGDCNSVNNRHSQYCINHNI